MGRIFSKVISVLLFQSLYNNADKYTGFSLSDSTSWDSQKGMGLHGVGITEGRDTESLRLEPKYFILHTM